MAKKQPAKRAPREKPDKLRPDVAETAFRVFQEAIGEKPKTLPPGQRTEKNAAAVKRGRKGGQKGGTARAASMTRQERAESASSAAAARWKPKPNRDQQS